MENINDKSSLCWRGSIGKMALYVEGEVSTRHAAVGLGYGSRARVGTPVHLSLKN